MKLRIAHTWDGEAVGPDEVVTVELRLDDAALTLRIDAPFHGDAAPDGPPGPTDGLWDYEVVELFVVGDDDHYTEIEVGPFGHHLVLQLEGVRNPVARCLPLALGVRRTADRWSAQATVERALLPNGPLRLNAYAIHGTGEGRRFLAMTPVPGSGPDFHRIGVFEVVV